MNIQRKIITNTSNYTPGREGNNVEHIVIHTYGGSGVSLYNWLQTNSVRVSCHYAVRKDGIVEQYVNEHDTAHHAGNWNLNLKSIGIEHQDDNNWNDAVRTDALYESSALLIADIFKRYGWKIEEWNHRIILHRNVPGVRAECPGALDIGRLYRRVSELLGPSWKQQFRREDNVYTIQRTVNLYNFQTDEVIKSYEEGVVIVTHYINHSNEWAMTEYSYVNNRPHAFKLEELSYVKPIELPAEEEKSELNLETQEPIIEPTKEENKKDTENTKDKTKDIIEYINQACEIAKTERTKIEKLINLIRELINFFKRYFTKKK